MTVPGPDLFPFAALAFGALAVFSLGAFLRGLPGWALSLVTLAALAAAAAPLTLPLPWPLLPAQVSGLSLAEGTTRFYMVLICSLTAGAVLFMQPYARDRGFEGDEIYALMLLATLGMLVLVAARDWMYFFLGLEMFSLPLYVLIGSRLDGRSIEAAVKYLIMGAVASSFLLFGIALIYAGSGTTDMVAGLAGAGLRSPVPLGVGLVLAGLGFKASLAPFHLWTPDVYEGAPAPVTAFLSTASKVAAFAALLRIFLLGGEALWPLLEPLVWGLAALTMVAGNLGALTQRSLKRILAFSSVSHMGYLLMALLAVPAVGPGPVLFYSAVYGLMDLGAFGGLALISPARRDLDDMESLDGLGRERPWGAGLLAVGLLALAGMPPTAGFMGKLVLFEAALSAGYVWLAVLGMAMAVLSIYYYLRPLTHLYMRPPAGTRARPSPTLAGAVAVGLVLAGLLAVGVMPGPLLDAARALAVP